MNALTPIHIRRVELDEAGLRVDRGDPGLYLHRDDVVAVLMGYAGQLDEHGKLGDNDHPVGLDQTVAELRHTVAWWGAREIVKMADFFKDVKA